MTLREDMYLEYLNSLNPDLLIHKLRWLALFGITISEEDLQKTHIIDSRFAYVTYEDGDYIEYTKRRNNESKIDWSAP